MYCSRLAPRTPAPSRLRCLPTQRPREPYRRKTCQRERRTVQARKTSLSLLTLVPSRRTPTHAPAMSTGTQPSTSESYMRRLQPSTPPSGTRQYRLSSISRRVQARPHSAVGSWNTTPSVGAANTWASAHRHPHATWWTLSVLSRPRGASSFAPPVNYAHFVPPARKATVAALQTREVPAPAPWPAHCARPTGSGRSVRAAPRGSAAACAARRRQRTATAARPPWESTARALAAPLRPCACRTASWSG